MIEWRPKDWEGCPSSPPRKAEENSLQRNSLHPALQCRRPGFNLWVREMPWRREVFWPGEFHGLYGSWDRKESERLSDFHFHFQPLHRKESTALRRTALLESREEGGLMGRGLQKQARGTGPVEGLGGSPKSNGKDCKQLGLGQVCTIKSLCKMSWQQEYQLEDYFYQGRDWIIFTRKMVGVEI